ncbi:hypothetical protein A3Q56_06471 [Intoshia linei]|uniref:Aquaporin-4 n=2 Tax=Intoshia linei TaxID=1819745 RepID=A0A177AUZ7_9BILA|nr:hypothetical protein A3Q56_06471 [Intoshia linei]
MKPSMKGYILSEPVKISEIVKPGTYKLSDNSIWNGSRLTKSQNLSNNKIDNILIDVNTEPSAEIINDIGTLLLVIIGCGSAITWSSINPPTITQISLTFGFSVAVIAWSIAHISGGHINPAVTFGLFCARRISIIRLVVYIVSQCLGAVIGALIVQTLTPDRSEMSINEGWYIGTPSPNELVSYADAFGVELIITFVLVFCVFATCDPKREDTKYAGPIVIGFSIAMCHLYAVPVTGSGMNPARVFGPAVVSGKWIAHWIYWLAPLIGGGIAGLLYELLFSLNASIDKMKAFIKINYDAEEYDDVESVMLTNVVTVSEKSHNIKHTPRNSVGIKN